MEQPRTILPLLTQWVKEVGTIHLAHFRASDFTVDTKSSHADVVTAIDRQSEKFLIDQIHLHFPSHEIHGEELGFHSSDSEWKWIIDPLDGTMNFVQGIPYFSVSVALSYRGEVVLGAVYAPCLNEVFTAIKGEGAWLNGQPIAVGRKLELRNCVISTGFPVDKATNPDNNSENVVRLLPHVSCLRRLGSAALDLCYVAAGFLDGFWELDLKIWDIAAGQLIAQEAGAYVSFLRPETSGRNYCPVAANGYILPEMLKYLL